MCLGLATQRPADHHPASWHDGMVTLRAPHAHAMPFLVLFPRRQVSGATHSPDIAQTVAYPSSVGSCGGTTPHRQAGPTASFVCAGGRAHPQPRPPPPCCRAAAVPPGAGRRAAVPPGGRGGRRPVPAGRRTRPRPSGTRGRPADPWANPALGLMGFAAQETPRMPVTIPAKSSRDRDEAILQQPTKQQWVKDDGELFGGISAFFFFHLNGLPILPGKGCPAS